MKPYRPSNGTEGYAFIESNCANCERDKDQDCPILAASLACDIDDPGYPKEWVYGDEGAQCTAFVERGQQIPVRCELTGDLFA